MKRPKKEAMYNPFALAYIAKGENARAAYLEVKPHVTEGTAGVEGHKLLKIPKVQQLIEKYREELRRRYALTTDRVVQQVARVAYFDPRRMLNAKGDLKKIHELDDDTAAAIQLEHDGKKVVRVRTPPPSAKNTAVEKAVKILRLYDKPLAPLPDEIQPEDRRDTARRAAFVLAQELATREHEKNSPPKPVKKKVSIPV